MLINQILINQKKYQLIAPVDSSKLSDVINKNVPKKNQYNKLVKNINAIKKTDYYTQVKDIDDEVPKLDTTTIFNPRMKLKMKHLVLLAQLLLLFLMMLKILYQTFVLLPRKLTMTIITTQKFNSVTSNYSLPLRLAWMNNSK